MVAGVGSSNGLGAALARRLAREGLLVFVAGRTEGRLEKIATEIIAARGKAVAVATDITSEKDVIRLLSLAEESGRLDLVVYNAGGNAASSLLQLKRSEFESLWKQSALGGFLVGREAIRRMLPHRQGTLIFTGATASVRARPPFTAFASAKAALRAVAQGFAREFGPQGIHVAHVIIDGEKTKIVYCKDANRRGDFPAISFDFLGFQFRARKTMWQGKAVHGFLPAASPKALTRISREVRRWRLHLRSDKSLQDLAEIYNPIIRGWIGYYRNFYRTQLRPTLVRIEISHRLHRRLSGAS